MNYQSTNITLVKHGAEDFSIGDLVKIMPDIIKWINSYGLFAEKSRYAKYECIIDEFCKMKTPYGPTASDKFSRLSESVLECFDIFYIYKSFQNETSDGFRERLKKSICGVELVSSSKLDEARNFLFELLIAADFARKKYSINFDNLTDVVATNGQYCVNAECKRVSSKKQLIKRLKKGCEQIKNRYISSEVHNLVFLDISTCLFEDIEKREFKSIEEACSSRNETMCNFLNKNGNSMLTVIDNYSDYISAFCAIHKSLVWIDNINISVFYNCQNEVKAPTNLSDDKFEQLNKIMASKENY